MLCGWRTLLGREEILGAQGRDSGLKRAEERAPRLQGQGAGSRYRLIQQPSATWMLAAGMWARNEEPREGVAAGL